MSLEVGNKSFLPASKHPGRALTVHCGVEIGGCGDGGVPEEAESAAAWAAAVTRGEPVSSAGLGINLDVLAGLFWVEPEGHEDGRLGQRRRE